MVKQMKRREFLGWMGAGLAGVAAGAPFVRVGTASAQARKKIVIGGSVPMSGPAAETGLNVYHGYLTAIQYINEELGGVTIGSESYLLELDMFDDASDPSRATTLIQRQIDQGVNFFLGSFGSNIVLPTAAIVDRARRPMVQSGGGSDLIFTKGYKYVFGIFPRASRQMWSSVEFFKSLTPRPQTVSVVYENDPFSRTQMEGAVKRLEEQAFKILETYRIPAQATDVSSVLASVKAKTPDILLCTTHDGNSQFIARQMISSNVNVNMLYQTLGPVTAAYQDALGKYAHSVVTQLYWDESVAYSGEIFGSAKAFAQYYRSNYTRQLAYHMASGAACIVAYVHAFRNAGTTDPQAVRDALAALDIDPFYGRIRFTEDGDGDPVTLGPLVGQLQHGKMEVVYPEKAATAQAIYPAPKWEER